MTSPIEVEADDLYDPAPYFERWCEELASSRKHLNSSSPETENAGSEFFFECLPGSDCDLTFQGVLHFDGHSVGNIRSPEGTLVVTRRGIVDADIEVAVALIHGCVTGNITANERVFLGDDARVTGQIRTPRLSAREGAVLNGDCLFTADPESEREVERSKREIEESEELLVGVYG